MAPPRLESIIDDLSVFDDWEDRYKYLIDLGRTLDPFPEALRTEDNRVRGCASQVWLETTADRSSADVRLSFKGESDAHIVRGLVALIIAAYSGKTVQDIEAFDAVGLFESLGLASHLSVQRSNGVRSMIQRIRADARKALDE